MRNNCVTRKAQGGGGGGGAVLRATGRTPFKLLDCGRAGGQDGWPSGWPVAMGMINVAHSLSAPVRASILKEVAHARAPDVRLWPKSSPNTCALLRLRQKTIHPINYLAHYLLFRLKLLSAAKA